MKVALIQLNSGNNKKKNIENACLLIDKAAKKKADFVLLPEVFNYRGPLDTPEQFNQIAEEIPGESLYPLMEIAKDNGIHILCGSIYERSTNERKVFNTSVVISDSGNIICKYRKINLFKAVISGKEINENKTYLAGDKLVTFNIHKFKIGLAICFDLRFPELFREYFNRGVDIIALPSSFTSRTGKLHWEVLVRARAIENYCYVLAPNQYGFDGNGVETYGHSMIVNPFGQIIDELHNQQEGIILHDIFQSSQKQFPTLD